MYVIDQGDCDLSWQGALQDYNANTPVKAVNPLFFKSERMEGTEGEGSVKRIYGLFFKTGHYIFGFHVMMLKTNCFFY